MCNVRMGKSAEEEEGAVTHFIGEGVGGAGGRVAGASNVCVAVYMAGGRCGGIRKCIFSSLKWSQKTRR